MTTSMTAPVFFLLAYICMTLPKVKKEKKKYLTKEGGIASILHASYASYP